MAPSKGDMVSPAKILAFDMYGTLVDPIGITRQLERYLPGEAPGVAEVWRQKQLEYTFRLTAMERYEDFEQITRKALDYALAATDRNSAQNRETRSWHNTTSWSGSPTSNLA
jgi:HAD superfamily hydrolase (TIGR01493 family)